MNWVRDEFIYREDGTLWRRFRTCGVDRTIPVGYKTKLGYTHVRIKGKVFKLHRLIYFYHYGVMPPTVDHIDGDPTNNKIENLRAATQQQNTHNRKLPATNTSGYKGVAYNKRAGKYVAYVEADGVRYHIGVYRTAEEAAMQADAKRAELHKEFARHK